jgi:hypothetical protein
MKVKKSKRGISTGARGSLSLHFPQARSLDLFGVSLAF